MERNRGKKEMGRKWKKVEMKREIRWKEANEEVNRKGKKETEEIERK